MHSINILFLASAFNIEAIRHEIRVSAIGLKYSTNSSDSKGMKDREGFAMERHITASVEGNSTVDEVYARIMQESNTYTPIRKRPRRKRLSRKRRKRLERKTQHFLNSPGLNRFTNPQLRGTGAFGEVWFARDTSSDTDVIVKVFVKTQDNGKKKYVTRNMIEMVFFEPEAELCDVVRQLPRTSETSDCSRICTCLGHNFGLVTSSANTHASSVSRSGATIQWGETTYSYANGTIADTLFILMPDCGASDLQTEYARSSVANIVARKLIVDVLKGIKCLQGEHIPLIHHDLKPANVVLTTSSPLATIIDFGAILKSNIDKKHRVVPCSPPYTPPEYDLGEAIFDEPYHSYDVYAAGLLYAWMLCAPRGSQIDRQCVVKRIKGGLNVGNGDAFSTCNADCNVIAPEFQAERDIIARMVVHDPRQRPAPSALISEIESL